MKSESGLHHQALPVPWGFPLKVVQKLSQVSREERREARMLMTACPCVVLQGLEIWPPVRAQHDGCHSELRQWLCLFLSPAKTGPDRYRGHPHCHIRASYPCSAVSTLQHGSELFFHSVWIPIFHTELLFYFCLLRFRVLGVRNPSDRWMLTDATQRNIH